MHGLEIRFIQWFGKGSNPSEIHWINSNAQNSKLNFVHNFDDRKNRSETNSLFLLGLLIMILFLSGFLIVIIKQLKVFEKFQCEFEFFLLQQLITFISEKAQL